MLLICIEQSEYIFVKIWRTSLLLQSYDQAWYIHKGNQFPTLTFEETIFFLSFLLQHSHAETLTKFLRENDWLIFILESIFLDQMKKALFVSTDPKYDFLYLQTIFGP